MVKQNTDIFQIMDNFSENTAIVSIPIIKARLDYIPKVTIAIPTYKRSKLLKEALDSALHQIEHSDFEVIVVDNNPNRDCETERLLNTYSDQRLSYYKNTENIGMFGNWNRCIELSCGEYLTILNDDDILSKEYLKSVNEILSQNKKIDAILVAFQFIDSNGKIMYEENNSNSKINRIYPLALLFGNINPGSLGILFLKSNLTNMGGYNKEYYPSSDYMFLVLYLANFENVFYLNKVLTNYRIAVNESNNISTLQGFIEVDKKIRKHFIVLYPKLKKLIELSMPIIEFKQLKGQCGVSEEFNEINSSKLKTQKNKINFKNKIAYELIIKISRLLKLHKLLSKTFHYIIK